MSENKLVIGANTLGHSHELVTTNIPIHIDAMDEIQPPSNAIFITSENKLDIESPQEAAIIEEAATTQAINGLYGLALRLKNNIKVFNASNLSVLWRYCEGTKKRGKK